jgi:hypothetical protein
MAAEAQIPPYGSSRRLRAGRAAAAGEGRGGDGSELGFAARGGVVVLGGGRMMVGGCFRKSCSGASVK